MQLDLVLHNARILTMDAARPHAHSIGMLHGRIVALDGDLHGLSARESVNLNGAVVVPGFNDAHCHTAWYGLSLAEVDLSDADSLDEVYRRLAAAAENDDDGWLVATGFDQHRFGGNLPELDVLDRITFGRPVFVRRASGHGGIANSEALRRAGVLAPGFPDPPGGHVVRDVEGNPTGPLQETAQSLVLDLLRPYSLPVLVDAISRATAQYAREGITSFTDAGIGAGWIGHSPAELSAFQRARETGGLHARAQLMPAIEALHTVDGSASAGLDLGIRSGFGDEWLSLGPAKIFLDGALSSETAALTEPYATAAENYGYLQDDAGNLRRRMIEAHRGGWSIAAHAIGDAAVDLALDTFEELRHGSAPLPLPNRIEHAAVIRPDQLSRLAELGVAVAPQASFFQAIGDAMSRSLGKERSRHTYRARSFRQAGVLLAGSSDRPCADGTALRCVQAYVDRLTQSGAVFGAAAERLTAHDALEVYTVGSARATGFGAVKGVLAPGMYADCAVLAESPLEVPTAEIGGLPVLATVAGGRFTHNVL